LERLENDQEDLFKLLDELGSDFGSEGENEEEYDFPEEPSIERPDEVNISSDSEDDLPLIHFQKLHWKHGNFKSKEFPLQETFTQSEVKTPYEYFSAYLNDNFFQSAASYTSQYFLQTNGKENKFTPQEIKTFFGMNALMGCIHFPRIHMYWNEKFKFSLIDGAMPRQRFYTIRVNLHVVDNLSVSEDEKKENKLWKIQPVIDLVRNRCKALERKEKTAFSIDEQMIPFLGRCPVRQFVKNKPRPVGLKNFVVTTSDGLMMDFEIYQGNTTPLKDRELGLGASVVLRLVEVVQESDALNAMFFSA
jgi:Transposase IS4